MELGTSGYREQSSCISCGINGAVTEHLAKGPALIKTPSGYVQQSPWLTVANKQLEIMGRFMAELGLSPSARARLRLPESDADDSTSIKIITLIAAENEGERNPDRLPVNVTASER
ncbi:P27 family phage terminase small subunit [Roseovarius mucosus]|uniref:P27 family phage terminase small subunit n=1 Tax=Roseovarius mucosus TaxID=215743 RepID=UPI002150EA67|nr:P27 family phage terminase small subunit [Roseovarius mucosus]